MNRALIISILLLLTACASKPFSWNTNDYTVRSGDTLYSIAWRFELNPKDLARWNKLSNSSLIHPGQRLHTRPSTDSIDTNKRIKQSSRLIRPPAKIKTKTIVVTQDETLYSIARQHKLTVQQLVLYNNIQKPYVIKPGQILKLSATQRVASSAQRKNTNTRQVSSKQVVSNQVVNWRWPIKGKLIKTFNKRLNDAKGIDIAGKEGKSIKAAASGKVVYSGNGLISYGNLIIIKHNDLYLSAYAHNRKLLVKEGQKVKVGQIIAELGKTGADNPRLHFEIRKNGKPVNPIRYLPSS